MDARPVMLGIGRLHFRIDHELDAPCQLAPRRIVELFAEVHRGFARIGGHRERGAIRQAVLRAHRVGRRDVAVVARGVAADADAQLFHVFRLDRVRAAHRNELLHRGLYPRAARIDLHIDLLHGPTLAEIQRQLLGPRRIAGQDFE